jgi:hypothetical protein
LRKANQPKTTLRLAPDVMRDSSLRAHQAGLPWSRWLEAVRRRALAEDRAKT